MTLRSFLPLLLLACSFGLAAAALDLDAEFEADNQDPYLGPGWNETQGGSPAVAFPSSGVDLRSWIPLGDFDPGATDGSDCWGYTSPSGREYAFLGLNNGTGSPRSPTLATPRSSRTWPGSRAPGATSRPTRATPTR